MGNDFNFHRALERGAALVDASIVNDVTRFGWGKKSAGTKVKTAEFGECWLRVQFVQGNQVNNRQWNGEVEGNSIVGVKKPKVFRFADWVDGVTTWRATLMTLISEPPCSATQELRSDVTMNVDWFIELERSLSELRITTTNRVCVRQDLISRRLSERFGARLDPTVNNWVTCHGDLHWANLTCPQLFILDWEGWGRGPVGLDAAFLLAFSMLVPDAVRRIKNQFEQELSTRDGMLSVLFACAELLRMIDLHGDHPDLDAPLKALAKTTMVELTAKFD